MPNNKDAQLEYAWNYFEIHAEQRLKTFNFYIVIMTLLVGSGATLISTKYYLFSIIILLLIIFFSFIFWKLDLRNKELIHNAEENLQIQENELIIKPFQKEKENKLRNDENNRNKFIKYHYTFSESFNLVFFVMGFVGTLILFFFLIYLLILYFNTSSLILSSLITFFCLLSTYFIFKNHKKKILLFISTNIILSSLNFIYFNKIIAFFEIKPLKSNSIEKNQNPEINIKMELKLPKDFSLKPNTLIYSNALYYEKGRIELNSELLHKDLSKIQKENLKSLNELLQNINKKEKYYIKIIGYSSTERINSKITSNKVNDNYQIALARTINTKRFLIDLLLENNFHIDNIIIDIFPNSNELSNSNHEFNRKVEIEIYNI